MIHEGMMLEASGPRLAMLMYAAELKLVVVVGLFSAAFLPIGAAADRRPPALVVGMASASVKLVAAAVALGAARREPREAAHPRPAGAAGRGVAPGHLGLGAQLWLPA